MKIIILAVAVFRSTNRKILVQRQHQVISVSRHGKRHALRILEPPSAVGMLRCYS